jgi:hypothetical protein
LLKLDIGAAELSLFCEIDAGSAEDDEDNDGNKQEGTEHAKGQRQHHLLALKAGCLGEQPLANGSQHRK